MAWGGGGAGGGAGGSRRHACQTGSELHVTRHNGNDRFADIAVKMCFFKDIRYSYFKLTFIPQLIKAPNFLQKTQFLSCVLLTSLMTSASVGGSPLSLMLTLENLRHRRWVWRLGRRGPRSGRLESPHSRHMPQV